MALFKGKGELLRNHGQIIRSAALLLPAGLIILLGWWDGSAELLAFNRSAINRGEIWRLVTGNFVHFTQYHSLMNALGLTACAYFLFSTQPLHRWWLCFAVVLLGVGLGLYWLTPELEEYRGMSGAVYGVLAAGAVLNFSSNPVIYGVTLLLLAFKTVNEQLPSFDTEYLLTQIGVPVAVDAHLFGTVGGLVVAGLLLLGARWPARRI